MNELTKWTNPSPKRVDIIPAQPGYTVLYRYRWRPYDDLSQERFGIGTDPVIAWRIETSEADSTVTPISLATGNWDVDAGKWVIKKPDGTISTLQDMAEVTEYELLDFWAEDEPRKSKLKIVREEEHEP